jgi:hypothetical protein
MTAPYLAGWAVLCWYSLFGVGITCYQ